MNRKKVGNKLSEIVILISDIRMVLDLEERLEAKDGVKLIGFADGEQIKTNIPVEAKDALKKKRETLVNLLKQKEQELEVLLTI